MSTAAPSSLTFPYLEPDLSLCTSPELFLAPWPFYIKRLLPRNRSAASVTLGSRLFSIFLRPWRPYVIHGPLDVGFATLMQVHHQTVVALT